MNERTTGPFSNERKREKRDWVRLDEKCALEVTEREREIP